MREVATWGPEALPRLKEMLSSVNVSLSASAADALVGVSPSDASTALAERLVSTTPSVRIICAGYLLRALELGAR